MLDKKIVAVERIDGGQKKVYIGEFEEKSTLLTDAYAVKYVVSVTEMMLQDGRVVNIPTADPAFCTSNVTHLQISGASLVKFLDPIEDSNFIKQYESVVTQAKAKMSGLVVPSKSGIITE